MLAPPHAPSHQARALEHPNVLRRRVERDRKSAGDVGDRPLPQRPRPQADRAPRRCPTAAPTSSSRPRTPAAMTSSPTWLPARAPFPGYPDGQRSRPLRDPCRRRPRARGTRPTTAPTPTWRPARDNGWSTDYVGLPADINPAAGSFSSVLGEADAGLEHPRLRGPGPLQPLLHRTASKPGSRCACRRRAGPGHGGLADPGVPLGEAGRQGREVLLRGRPPPGLRLQIRLRARRQHRRQTSPIYDRDLSTGTTQIVSTTTERRDPMTGRRDLRARHLRRRLADPDRQAESPPTRPATNTSTPTCTSATRPRRRPGPRRDRRRPLRRDDRRRLEGLLHHRRPLAAATPTPAPTSTKPPSTAARQPSTSAWSRRRRTPTPATRSRNSAGAHWNTIGATANCGAVAIGGGGGVASGSGAVYFLSPEQLDGGEGTREPAEPLLAAARAAPQLRRHARARATRSCSTRSRTAATRETGDFQVTPDGDYAAFPSDLRADRRRQLRLPQRLPLRRRRPNRSTASPATRRATTDSSFAGDAALAPTASASPTTAASSSPPGRRSCSATPTGARDVYEWEDGDPQLISSGIGAFDSGLLTGSAPTASTSSSSPTTRWPPKKTTTAQLMKIYDARAGGGFFNSAAGALRRLRRVPRRRHRSRRAAGHQDLGRNDRRQRPRLPARTRSRSTASA